MKLTPGIINCEDEISTGLDSAVTIDIMKNNAKISQMYNKTLIISLLQPPPDALTVASDVLLLSEGRLIYHAPVADLEPYFNELGFKRPPNVALSDFMVDLCTSDNAMYYSGSPVPTPADLSDIWYKSDLFKSYIQPRLDDNTYEAHHPEENENFRYQYGAKFLPMAWINMVRFWKFSLRDFLFMGQRTVMSIFLALMLG